MENQPPLNYSGQNLKQTVMISGAYMSNPRIALKGKMTFDKVCEVNTIDLRPIGLEIHGNENGFYIANSNFSGNTFQGSGFLVGISEKQNAE